MANKGKPYRSLHRIELDRIEARRAAAGISIDELAAKAGLHRNTYGRMKRSGLAFKRHVTALAMAMRTLEADKKREGELFPGGPGRSASPGQPPDHQRPFGDGSSTGSRSGPGQPRSRR